MPDIVTDTPSVTSTDDAAAAQMHRLAQHLVSVCITTRCELVDSKGSGERCRAKAVAVRWEDGFADFVCEHHAHTAEQRGALIVHAKRHTGESV